MPSLGAFGAIETQAAVRQLVADIAFAQSQAVAHQTLHRVEFHADGSGWSLVHVDEAAFFTAFNPASANFVDDPAAIRRGGGDFVMNLTTDDRFHSVVVESVDTAENSTNLTFDALGGTLSAPGTAAGGAAVILAGDDSRWEVAVAPVTGRTSVRKLN